MPFVRFSLIYDGPLPASGNKSKKEAKWAIRKAFHPQMEHLWTLNKDLAWLKKTSVVPKTGAYLLMPPHHLSPRPELPPDYRKETAHAEGWETIDLCEPIRRAGREFFPLVRSSLALTCGLKILFMRQEARGRVYQGGDLDGRLKTLLDALSAPAQDNEVCDDPDCPPLVYTLLENDELVTGLEVQTERLLSRPDEGEDAVRLVVTADVRVTVSRQYNDIFLAD